MNQCDGCREGMPVVDGIHQDSKGRNFMCCSKGRYLMKVYLLIDDYTPDVGSTIYGVFATEALAQEKLDSLSSDDNEYGCSQNEDDTIYIQEERVTTYA